VPFALNIRTIEVNFMSNNSKHNDLNQSSVPFFARYLEGQIQDLSEEEMTEISGGSMMTTMRYPSDNEDAGNGTVVTQKYPSDDEDAGMGMTSKTVDCDFIPDSNNFPSLPNFPSF
jgi:Serine endopeptidase inhibitors